MQACDVNVVEAGLHPEEGLVGHLSVQIGIRKGCCIYCAHLLQSHIYDQDMSSFQNILQHAHCMLAVFAVCALTARVTAAAGRESGKGRGGTGALCSQSDGHASYMTGALSQ